ncbi:inosine/uridine-preferring nucleoside hydrolase [Kipferlia bialata]|uniref:Inosine/uridine-preferring nucleoside hydrolase n=1 Tax=Kipferlia bialata TaxID=797122 RepID=A0A9K3CNY4_9EUKA|nr:inosine/uridine-preferring nucleoside hydrolase [Kipferlia bialata]|eukprot:g1430.t1
MFISGASWGGLELVYKGSAVPLVRKSQICPEIHGETGLGGVDWAGVDEYLEVPETTEAPAMAMHRAVSQLPEGETLTLLVTGCMTNIALYLRQFPQDIPRVKVVCMGGVFRERGNTGSWAEFNAQIDPEALQVVLDSGAPLTMIPLDVTHTVLADEGVMKRIGEIGGGSKFSGVITQLLMFFADTYKNVFGFTDGPPVHDPVAAFYITHPEAFETVHVHVDVECEGTHTAGATCADWFGFGGKPANCTVALKVDTKAFWDEMIDALISIDKRTPLNEM